MMAFEVAVSVFVYVGVPPARHSVVLNVWRHPPAVFRGPFIKFLSQV